jgi:hypothetical protein
VVLVVQAEELVLTELAVLEQLDKVMLEDLELMLVLEAVVVQVVLV